MEPILQANQPPRLNGRYVVTRQLGKGAQARVYLGFDTRLKQWRALKVLAANFLDDAEIRARFEQEAEAMARLSHPNLLRVVDVDAHGRTPFIVMELARGGGLTQWMKRNGALAPRQACQVAMQVCDGLDHAHSQGVVHRDVKPHNLLIADDGRILLTDFGIAQVAEGLNMTQTGSVMGTFAYMAPEQRSDSKSVDARADVYSLGATLYTLVTLRTSAELFFADALDAILAPVPEPIRDVILDACQYDKAARTESALALKEALREAMNELPPDPPTVELLADLLELADEPPQWLDPTADVDDLQKVLALSDDDAPTYIGKQAPAELDRMLEEQSTTLYTDTDYSEPGEAMPYRMPRRETSSSSRVRASIAELSEEDVPEYIDVSTIERRPPGGRRERVEIEPTGVRHIPTVEAEADGRSPWFFAAAGVVAAVTLILVVLAGGVLSKFMASQLLTEARQALIETAQEHHGVVQELSARGGNRQALEDAFFQFQDAPTGEAAVRAALFAEVAAAEASRVGAEGMGRMQAEQLSQANDEYLKALAALEAARASRVGRATGNLGIQ